MTTPRRLFAVALTAALAVASALDAATAQTGLLPELQGGSASAPPRSPSAPVGPRLRSPAETADRATAPGDLRPERPVTPQINIPLGKRPAPPASGPAPRRIERIAPRADVPASGGVDDAAARCESEIDAGLRAECRARRARETPPRPPG